MHGSCGAAQPQERLSKEVYVFFTAQLCISKPLYFVLQLRHLLLKQLKDEDGFILAIKMHLELRAIGLHQR